MLKKEVCHKITTNIYNFSTEEKRFLDKLIKDDIVRQSPQGFSFSKKYNVGTISFQTNKIIFQKLNSDKKVYIDISHLNGANDGDFVLASIIFNPRGKTKVKVKEILEYSLYKQLTYVQDKKLLSFKNSMPIEHTIQNIKKLKELDVVLIDKDTYKVLGNLHNAKLDDMISLYLHKQEYRLEEYKTSYANDTISFDNRVDLTNLDFCTIDPKSAKDHDDAIYYSEQEEALYVAIADVSNYVKEGSSLDMEARKRAFSVYFPNKVLPMLPFVLSNDLCSLKPNKLRYAFVCKMYIDTKSIKIKKSEFFEAVIESKNNFSYEYIDSLISKKKLTSSLHNLYTLSKKFREKRLQQGYDFRSSEYRLILNEDEEIIKVTKEDSTPSHSLVEECMLLTNQEAARKLQRRGIFRIHEEPDLKKIDTLLEALGSLGIKTKKKKDIHSTIISIQQKAKNVDLEHEVDKLIIESQQQARYSPLLASHFGLGFSHYSHFTSPIRRYSDLILHRLLKSNNIPDDLENICEDISNIERNIALLVWDLEDRKYARWANKNINKIYDGIIVENEKDIKAELVSGACGLRLYITNYNGEKLFQKVKVSIESANYATKNIFGKIVYV